MSLKSINLKENASVHLWHYKDTRMENGIEKMKMLAADRKFLSDQTRLLVPCWQLFTTAKDRKERTRTTFQKTSLTAE